MQILTAGVENKRGLPFWAQQSIVCSNCSCEFQLEDDDSPMVTLERAEAGGTPQFAHVYCPHCEQRVSIPNPGFVPPLKTDAEKLEEEQAAHAATLAALQAAQARIDELSRPDTEGSVPQ